MGGFNRRRDACFTATPGRDDRGGVCSIRFNRRRDACFPATPSARPCWRCPDGFQSQTRRLLPRNRSWGEALWLARKVSIADATLASPQRVPGARPESHCRVSIADATLASPQPGLLISSRWAWVVSIADATLASPQPPDATIAAVFAAFVSIADATLASPQLRVRRTTSKSSAVSIADATLASPQPHSGAPIPPP